jgi:hypothetical protein
MKFFISIFFTFIFSFPILAQNKKVPNKNTVSGSRSNSVYKSNNKTYLTQSVQNYNRNYNQSVRDFIEGKYFRNSQTGLRIKYGYISSGNTFGLTFVNSYGNEFYFINCSDRLSLDEQYMELTNCMSPEDGSGIGRVGIYKDRIIITASDGSLTYFLEN